MTLFGKLRTHSRPGVGKKFKFHGGFASKTDAVKREREVHGFIVERKVKGQKRYYVLTER